MSRYQGLNSSDLFRFDTLALRDDILLIDGRTASKVEYDEYVVFKKDKSIPSGPEPDEEGGDDVSFKLNHTEETPGYQMLDLAFRRGWVVDHNVRTSESHPYLHESQWLTLSQGDFTQEPARDPALVLDGRVRRV